MGEEYVEEALPCPVRTSSSWQPCGTTLSNEAPNGVSPVVVRGCSAGSLELFRALRGSAIEDEPDSRKSRDAFRHRHPLSQPGRSAHQGRLGTSIQLRSSRCCWQTGRAGPSGFSVTAMASSLAVTSEARGPVNRSHDLDEAASGAPVEVLLVLLADGKLASPGPQRSAPTDGRHPNYLSAPGSTGGACDCETARTSGCNTARLASSRLANALESLTSGMCRHSQARLT